MGLLPPASMNEVTAEQVTIPQITMERIAALLRRQASELEKIAPMESMYLCSVAHKLELKAAKLTGN